MLMPSALTIRPAAPAEPSERSAAMNPSGMPTRRVTMIVSNAIVAVTGSLAPNSSDTETLDTKEYPRSPVKTPKSQWKYWATTGSSSPDAATAWARCASVASGPRTRSM